MTLRQHSQPGSRNPPPSLQRMSAGTSQLEGGHSWISEEAAGPQSGRRGCAPQLVQTHSLGGGGGTRVGAGEEGAESVKPQGNIDELSGKK